MTHHAYYVEDSPSRFDAYQSGVRAAQRFEAHDPNFVAERYEKFGIDEARELQALASLKKTGSEALFLLAISSITTEAQQALLKLFEEPQEGLTFVLLVPPGTLIPTLRSRMLPYPDKLAGVRLAGDAGRFLAAASKERSAMIAELLEEEEWTKDRVRDFLNGLEAALYPRLGSSPPVRAGLEDIAKVRSYVGDRSPSLKMLLEHLALSLPTLSSVEKSEKSGLDLA